MGYNGNSRLEDGVADWSFVLEDGDLHTACKYAAKRAVREFEAVEYDDAYQSAVLFLAVRPELQEQFRDGTYEGVSHMADRIYTNALRPTAVRESEGAKLTVSYDQLADFELGGDE